MKNMFEPFYDPIDMSCCVNTEDSLDSLQVKMNNDKLFFPFYQEGFSLRDILSHSNYGSYSYRYGALADNILGVLFENANGVPLQIGARVVKNVTGFDFTRFFTQNENEFGKIKKAILRLRPKPDNIVKYSFINQKVNCEKLTNLLLHSTWATSLMGLDFIGTPNNYKIEIMISGNLEEEILIKNILEGFALQCGGQLVVQTSSVENKTDFIVQGNLLLSKNIGFGDYLVKNFGGSYQGFLGNGYFIYHPQNIEKLIENEIQIINEINKIHGSIYWRGFKNQNQNLKDIREKLLIAMKEIK